MSQNYTPEFKKKILRLHEEEGRTYKSITAEYCVSKATVSAWCKQFREKCQTSPELKAEYLPAASGWLVVAKDEGNEIPAATPQHKMDIPNNATCSIIRILSGN